MLRYDLASMADVFSPDKRSEIMSLVKGRGNVSTELRMVSLLRQSRLSGWRRHLQLPGTPDFAFKSKKVALFVDGCFWHGCPTCYSRPKRNASFWEKKISSNRSRDARVGRILRKKGWTVLRVWECGIRKTANSVLRRIKIAVGQT